MSQSYVKECIFCKAKIRMSDKSGKWLPSNLDGTEHDCKSKQKSVPINGNDISLELVLRKLKTVGVTLDLDVLRNAVNGDKK